MANAAFNSTQLASYDEARALRDYLNALQPFAGNQILPGDDELNSTPVANPNFPWLPPTVAFPRAGIFLPTWSSGPHGDPEPNDGAGRLFLHFRTTLGHQAYNVGLCIDKFKRFPASPDYVVRALASEMAV